MRTLQCWLKKSVVTCHTFALSFLRFLFFSFGCEWQTGVSAVPRLFHKRAQVSIALKLLPVFLARKPRTRGARLGSEPQQRVSSHLTMALRVHCIARKRRLTTHRTITCSTSTFSSVCAALRLHVGLHARLGRHARRLDGEKPGRREQEQNPCD